ncbi:helix-turn-helix domain-containing protein [Lolliginicoccus lacisalsi]|uniref:helix-turn-helix domain-containing protein n=1 Tax=Lolliginicoccus lacisalsi TaxID=2742202 RepID=UPI0038CBF911
MTARPPGPAGPIEHHHLDALVIACRHAIRNQTRNGITPWPELHDLHHAAITALAATGHTDTPTPPAIAESSQDENPYCTTREAARILGCSPRTIRRLAPKLSAQLHAGRWLIPHEVLHQHKGTP